MQPIRPAGNEGGKPSWLMWVALAIILSPMIVSLFIFPEGQAVIIGSIFAVIVVGIVVLIGLGSGKGFTAFRLNQLKKRGIVRPEYEKFEDCTPAEFGVIIDGQCSRDELIAEIVHLYFRGYITFEKMQDGTIQPRAAANVVSGPMNDIDTLLLASLQGGSLPNPDQFKSTVMQSLASKEWIIERRSSGVGALIRMWKRIASLPLAVQIFLAFVVTVSIIFVAFCLGMLVIIATADGSDPMTYVGGGIAELVAAALLVGFIMAILLSLPGIPAVIGAISLAYLLIDSFKGVTVIARNYSPKYRQHYRDVLGLHQYLSVSGMDTMTPDYTNLDFKGLDPLYPYAIAAGLDKNITKML